MKISKLFRYGQPYLYKYFIVGLVILCKCLKCIKLFKIIFMISKRFKKVLQALTSLIDKHAK